MMIPHRTPFFLPLLFPSSLIWRFPPTQRSLYLTFDDGPVPGPTEFVLDVLDQYQCKGTFFCIGDNVRKHPEVYARIHESGHAIGNHSYNHVNGWRTPLGDYVDNVNKCQDVLGTKQSDLFRPPYGRITYSQIKSLKDFRVIMWDVLSLDYEKHLSAESCLRNTIRATRPGSIVVFHDSLKAERNLTHTLPRFIEHFLEKGFTFKKIE